MNALAQQTAMITGASSGIGRAIALTLARRECRLALIGRRRQALEAVAAEARSLAPDSRPEIFIADLTEDGAVRRLVEQLADHEIDLLIQSLGLFAMGPLETFALDDFDALFHTNVRAPFVLTRALLPAIRRQQGQIVLVNSTAGVSARGGFGAYAASKHALKAFADSLRDEVNPHGVRVMTVYPGRTATPMQEEVVAAEGRPYRPQRLLQPQDIADMVVASLALPRTAEVTDLHIRPLQTS